MRLRKAKRGCGLQRILLRNQRKKIVPQSNTEANGVIVPLCSYNKRPQRHFPQRRDAYLTHSSRV